MEIFTDPEAWISLVTLTFLEIVLGIDNVIFISILADKLPKEQQNKGRRLGLAMAMITRVLLLFGISWVMKLTAPLFNLSGIVGITNAEWVEKLAISGRDLILIVGGLFLIYKSTAEIHHKIEGDEESGDNVKAHSLGNNCADHAAGYRFLPRFCNYCCWYGAAHRDNGSCSGYCCWHYDVVICRCGQLCEQASNGKNAGLIIPVINRRFAFSRSI